MKIKNKITLLQLSTVLGILLSIYILYSSFIDIQKLKNIEVSFNKAVDLEYTLNDLMVNTLYTHGDIVAHTDKVLATHLELVSLLNTLYESINRENREILTSFRKFYYTWYQENTGYYLPITRYFRQIIRPFNGLLPIVGQNGLEKAIDIINEEIAAGRMTKEKTVIIQSTIDLLTSYSTKVKSIHDLMIGVQKDLIYQTEKNIATNALILILIVLFIILIATILSTKLSTSLIYKIENVEKSLEKIGEGDLHIQSETKDLDEFNTLNTNFNLLSTMLLSKTESMREIMNEISGTISESVNMDALLIKITEMAKESSNADAATILLVDKFTDILRVEHLDGFFPPPYPIPVTLKSKRSLIEDKFKSTPIAFGSCYITKDSVLKGKPLLVKDTIIESDLLPINSNPQDILFIKSSMTIPLVVSNKLLGVISLAKTTGDSTFSDLDFSNMISFVEYVSLTIDNLYKYMELLEKSEMKREMNIASQIQERLLPKKIPVISNIDVSAFSENARGISGDYYDIYKVSKTRSVATVCDVAGKGIAAALVLVIIRTILQLASNGRSTAKDLLTFLNNSLSDRVKIDYFATLSLLIYDSDTNTTTLSVAGETPILIYRVKEQKVDRIYHNNLPVGIEKGTEYKNIELDLDEDDILYMFSDGLLEVRNDFNDIFSIEELESFILENSNNRTETISVLLKNYLDEFRGSQPRMDDETVIIFKRI